MLKKDEIATPDSCLNKAKDDEPIFVLRGKDPAAPATLAKWINRRVELGLNDYGDRKTLEAANLMAEMQQYQAKLAEEEKKNVS